MRMQLSHTSWVVLRIKQGHVGWGSVNCAVLSDAVIIVPLLAPDICSFVHLVGGVDSNALHKKGGVGAPGWLCH